MRIGALLTIEYIDRNGVKEKYQSKLIEKDSRYIYIDLPIHIKTRRTKFFSIGTPIFVSYVGKDLSVYRYKTYVMEKLTLTVPALAIEIPEKGDMERIQRRKYVRIETQLDVAIHSVRDRFQPFTTVTNDISGGGISIVVPREVELEPLEEVTAWVVLRSQDGKYDYLKLYSEIVRIIPGKHSLNMASLKFVNIDLHTQQKIIQFCFEKQREARQKEIQ